MGSIKLLKRNPPLVSLQVCQYSSEANFQWNIKKTFCTALGLAVAGGSAIIYALEQSVKAYDWPVHPPHYPWSHKPFLHALDHASIRRGFQVYRNVCSACHSLQYVPFRRLIDVAFTEEEMMQIASEYQIQDGPNELGDYFMRPGKTSDYLPSPYPNDDAAAAANNGAAPPDLSLIVLAREGNEDYILSLLSGYVEPEDVPAGVEVPDGGHYNPYFLGSVIAMAPPLYNNIIEYDDGTPATRSQLAKDVITFLTWCSQPEYDKRQLFGIKANLYFALFIAFLTYITRHKWTSLRSRIILYNELAKKK